MTRIVYFFFTFTFYLWSKKGKSVENTHWPETPLCWSLRFYCRIREIWEFDLKFSEYKKSVWEKDVLPNKMLVKKKYFNFVHENIKKYTSLTVSITSGCCSSKASNKKRNEMYPFRNQKAWSPQLSRSSTFFVIFTISNELETFTGSSWETMLLLGGL